jgi:hypothetical protein
VSDTHSHAGPPPLHGVMAEFKTADELIAATRKAREAGYTRMDGFSPYPVGEVADELGFPRSEIGAIMFIGGVCGATMGFLMQTWVSVIDYPISIGGKPFWSWPQYVPVSWALVFNVDRFTRATRDRFFLLIEAVDPQFEAAKAKEFLASLHPDDVAEVPE